MHNRQQRNIILVLGILTAIGSFSIDTYLPSFPDMAASLHTTVARVGLSLTSFFIGISAGQLIYGPLLDRYGRKIPLLTGLVIYILSSVMCGLSPNINFLIVVRLIQALGACACIVASRAVVRDLFPPKETAKIFSMLMLVMGVAPIVAPSIGGFISTHFGWRVIFFMLAGIGLLMFRMVYTILPESWQPDHRVSLKLNHVLEGYLNVFADRKFLTFTLTGGLVYAGLFAYISGAPFVFMKIFGLSESQFGLVFSMNAAGLIGGSQLNRLVLKRWGSYRISYVLINIMMIVALLLVTGTWFNWLNLYTTLTLIFSFMFLIGFINPNIMAIALEPFSENAGRASALLGSMQMVFGALSSALVSTMFDGTSRPMVLVMMGCATFGLMLVMYYHVFVHRKMAFVTMLRNFRDKLRA